jgi:hypothetical protein
MSAETWSPEDGTLLGDFVALIDALEELPELSPAARGPALRQVAARADALRLRVSRNEPCVKAHVRRAPAADR